MQKKKYLIKTFYLRTVKNNGLQRHSVTEYKTSKFYLKRQATVLIFGIKLRILQ